MVAEVGKKVNIYTCNKCGNKTITIIVENDGVTPAFIGCDKCKDGESWSHFFACPQNLKPKYEWFKPKNDDEIKNQIKWEMVTFYNTRIEASLASIGITFNNIFENTKEHIRLGGLLMRPILGEPK